MKRIVIFLILFLLGLGVSLLFRSRADQSLEIIRQSSDRSARKQALMTLLGHVGPERTQELLFASGLPFDGETHLLVHTVGDYIYKKFGVGGLSQCKDYFLSACYHAFLINDLADHGVDGIVQALSACQKKGKNVFIQCMHAAGHGFLAWTDYDLLQSLSLCDSLAEKTGSTVFNCHDGVFMENIYGIHSGVPSQKRWIKSDDFFYPCNDERIEEKYKGACWSNQATVVYQAVGGDLKKVALFCDSVENEQYQTLCYHNFARQIHPMTQGDEKKALTLCQNATGKTWQAFCLQAVASSASFVGGRVIQMTTQGFIPQEMTVQNGEAVTFVNDDSVPHWPASDPHPIHDDYAAFDPGKSIGPGESWTFTPTRVGLWRFHDHRGPQIRGKLTVRGDWVWRSQISLREREWGEKIKELWERIVGPRFPYGLRLQHRGEDKNAYILSQMKLCAVYGNRSPCYKAVTDIFSRQFSTTEILHSFKAIESESSVYSRCHEVGHYLGRKAYLETKSIQESYARCDVMVCGVGCQHGAAEEFFREKQVSRDDADEALADIIRGACGDEKSYSRQILYHECLHGLGHGIMTFTDMDLPRSVKLCDALVSDWDQEGCYAGAFMENSTSATSLDHPSRFLKPDDPTYPCSILDEKYWKLCYQYQSSYFGEQTGWQWEETAQLCQQIPGEYQIGCLNQVATNQAMATRDPVQTKKTCDLLPDRAGKDTCVEEVVSTFGGRYIDEPQFMIDFCSVVNSENKETCYRQLGGSIRYWGTSQDKVDGICQTLPTAESQEWCKIGKEENREKFQ